MPKGYFTQSTIVLLEAPPSQEMLETVLQRFHIVHRQTARVGEGTRPGHDWMGSYPSLVLAMRPEVNGYVVVDIVDHPWPDDMGSVTGSEEDSMLFAAWGMGWFGPFVYPGSLERAVAQCHGWPGAADAVARHRAFARIKTSYVLGSGREAPVVPNDYEPLDELWMVTNVARSLLTLPESVAYFNPNGEALHAITDVEESLEFHEEQGLIPLEVWTSVRGYRFPADPSWMVVDTVGLAQLDEPDQEACFPVGEYSLPEIAHFLRRVAAVVAESGSLTAEGERQKGPGEIEWQARLFDEGIQLPPRPVVRWFPVSAGDPPGKLLKKRPEA